MRSESRGIQQVGIWASMPENSAGREGAAGSKRNALNHRWTHGSKGSLRKRSGGVGKESSGGAAGAAAGQARQRRRQGRAGTSGGKRQPPSHATPAPTAAQQSPQQTPRKPEQQETGSRAHP